jgi:L-ascorbate metabolism protein UlaG (beta-lactamase superfamily)
MKSIVIRIIELMFLSIAALSAGDAPKKQQEDVFKTSGGELKITFIGHSSLMVNYAGKVIHIDPVSTYADYATLAKADLILVTHEHPDHLDKNAIQAVGKADAAVIVNTGGAKSLPNAAVMKNGDTRTEAGIPIEATPAYNPVSQFHKKGNGNGYVLTFGDKRVFIAGDTENVPEIKALKNIDIAFLPLKPPNSMTPEQMVDTAKAIRPKVLYPYHMGNTDPAKLMELIKDEKGIEVRIRDLK